MNLEEATAYLKKIGEWETVLKMEREVILNWANFLKEREEKQNKTTKKKSTARSI